MRTAGVGDKNRDDEGAAARSWILDPGYSILDTRCRILEARCWFLVPGHWFLVPGYLSLVTCYLSLVTGYWSLVSGYLLLVTGYWLLVTCHWSLVTGHLSLITGPWSLVAEIVDSESYLLTHGVFLYLFFYHYNLTLIFSELFLEFKHIFREYAAYCQFKTLWFEMMREQSNYGES